jgi:hypothetical protein
MASFFIHLQTCEDLQVDRRFCYTPPPQMDLRLILPGAIEELGISFPEGMGLPWMYQLHEQLGSFPQGAVLILPATAWPLGGMVCET